MLLYIIVFIDNIRTMALEFRMFFAQAAIMSYLVPKHLPLGRSLNRHNMALLQPEYCIIKVSGVSS